MPVQQAVAGQTVVVYHPTTNGLAVVSLVFGIISWFLCPVLGAIIAVITGHVARGQIRRTGESGSGLAIAGLVLGYFHLVAAVLVLVVWLILLGGLLAFLAAIGAASTTPSP